MAFDDSARAVPATNVTAVRQTAKPPADSPMQRSASDLSFDFNPSIISSLHGAAPSREGNSTGPVAQLPTERRPRFFRTSPRHVIGLREHDRESSHHRTPRARIECPVVAPLPLARHLTSSDEGGTQHQAADVWKRAEQ